MFLISARDGLPILFRVQRFRMQQLPDQPRHSQRDFSLLSPADCPNRATPQIAGDRSLDFPAQLLTL